MADQTLSPEVRQFISRHIPSVEELEILLLLMNGESQAWTVDRVFQVILSSKHSVEKGLEKFVAAGLVQKSASSPTTFTIQPTDAASTLRELARCYREAPVRVIEAIYQKNRDSVQGFADAFKFKRDP